MRKILFFLTCATLFVATYASAASVDGCTVRGIHPKHTNDYYGDVTCENANKPSINIVGTLTIDQSQINGLTNMTGTVSATNTIFNAITVTNDSSPGLIFLKDSTLVKGVITFVHEAGTVCMDSSSMLLRNVVNGHVEQC